MQTYIIRIWTGPCSVGESAERMRATAAAPFQRVAIEGTEHVYVHYDATRYADLHTGMHEWLRRANIGDRRRYEILKWYPYTNAPAAAPDGAPLGTIYTLPPD